jgi:cytochrome P450
MSAVEAKQSAITSKDSRYEEIFDLISHAKLMGVDLVEDPFPRLAEARAKAPVHPGTLTDVLGIVPKHKIQMFEVERPHFIALSFATIDELLTKNDIYSSSVYYEFFPTKQFGKSILHLGGTEHRQYRGTVQPLFTRRNVIEWWQPTWITGLVDELVSTFEKKGKADLNQELCARLPMHTITRAFGLPSEDALDFRYHLMRGLNMRISKEDRAVSDEVVSRLLARAIAARRASPGNDVITRLVAAEFIDEDGTRRVLSDDEIVSFCKLIIAAGGGTTWRQLGITLVALLTHPDQFEAVKQDRQLIDAAIAESLRWHNTSPHFFRLTTQDVELGGVAIPKGAIVEFNLNAANRDPARWVDPDRYDIYRAQQRHLAFAAGPHACLGMYVAQAEMRIAINALIDRCPNLRLDPDFETPRVTGTLEMRGASHVNVIFD